MLFLNDFIYGQNYAIIVVRIVRNGKEVIMGELVFGSSMYLIMFVFLILYFYFKTVNGFQAYQQSAYDPKRYLKYIRENYKYTFGANELLPIIFLIFLNKYPFLSFLLTAIALYYNLQFFQIAKMRYREKLPWRITPRVRRQLATFIILSFILLVVGFELINMLDIGDPISKVFIIVALLIAIQTYIINGIILLVGIINSPVEKYIQSKFKKQASDSLKNRDDLLVIGITGSYGKTSIKNIISDILQEFEITLKTPSSYNTPMGLAITINDELSNLHENFIAEMGAYREGEILELAEMVEPQIGVVSSIGPQHLETFGDISVVQKTKMELVENLPSDGLAVLNYDNEYIRNYDIKNDVNVKWYSLENPDVDLYAYDFKYLPTGTEFKIQYEGDNYDVKTRQLGKHSIYNLLAAILIADYKGLNMMRVIDVISTIEPVKSRLELKYINPELTLIDDSFNGNIEGMTEGLNVLRMMESERKILITPGLIDGGEANAWLNEEYASKITDDVTDIIFIGKYNYDSLMTGLDSELVPRVKYFDNFLDAYSYATGLPGTKTVLIANDLPDKYNV